MKMAVSFEINNRFIKSNYIFVIFMIISLLISGCSTKKKWSLSEAERNILAAENSKKYVGHYKIGSPYVIKGHKYFPKKNDNHKEVGIASWYGERDGFHGNKTANGDVFNKNNLTAAHKTLPMPSLVKITNLANNKSLIVMINDRGPYSKGRVIDVSERVASILEFKNHGTAKVEIEYLPEETRGLLAKLALPSNHGSLPLGNIRNPSCNVSCYLELVNDRHYISLPKISQVKDSKQKHSILISNVKTIKEAEKLVAKLKKFAKFKIIAQKKGYSVQAVNKMQKADAKNLVKKIRSLSISHQVKII